MNTLLRGAVPRMLTGLRPFSSLSFNLLNLSTKNKNEFKNTISRSLSTFKIHN